MLTLYRWSYVEYVSVFNEAVNDGRATVSQVATAITYVKSQLPNNIPVTTIDTFSAYIANPSLCNVGQDFIATNIQPYFSAVEASTAGAYVVQQQLNVASTCGVTTVQITGKKSPVPTVWAVVDDRIRLASKWSNSWCRCPLQTKPIHRRRKYHQCYARSSRRL